jgi:hypothetical protein
MTNRDKSDDETNEKDPPASEPSDPVAVRKAAESDADDSDDDAATDSDEAVEAAEPERKRPARKSGKKSRRGEERAAAAPGVSTSRLGLFVVIALAAGAAAGWFGHIAQAKAKLRSDSAPAASGSGAARGPCGVWEQKLCASGGEGSAMCQQAKAASDILTPGTCEVALEAVPATLAKVKAERVSCDQLMTKLCADLPPESPACKLVKEKTPTFPSTRCTEMLGGYPEVLANLKSLHEQLSAQGGPGSPLGASPHGGPRMGMPPGGPGAPPH